MVKITVAVAPPPGKPLKPGQPTFATLSDPVEVSRVPCVGEYITLSVDKTQDEAVYYILLVNHIARGVTAADTVADVRAILVDFSKATLEAVAKAATLEAVASMQGAG